MKLSIITVNLNNREGLQRTINSVIAQTWRNFEWIVIDGGSTDGSKELIEQYSDNFAYWVSEPDSGVYNAMNKGVKVAKGEYCLFLNSGDWLCNATILENVFSKDRNADILYGYMQIDNPKSDTDTLTGTFPNQALMKPTLHWTDFIGNTLPHQSTFIRKHLFDIIGLYDETYQIVADNKFFIQAIVWHKCSYEFIPLVISRFRSGGISSSNLRFKERDRRLRIEMFPKMVLDDYSTLLELQRIKRHKLLRKCYTLLSIVAEKIEKNV